MPLDEIKPFEHFMEDLSQAEQVSIPMLFRLTDMGAADLAHFRATWPTIPTEQRQIIVRHLADISEENYQVDFSDVFGLCLTDESAEVRLAALDGLWDTEREALVQPIIRCMESDDSPEVRAAAAATLGHFILLAEWNQIRSAVTAPIVPALLAQIDSPETSEAVRRAALESLGSANHPRVAGLIEDAYDSGDFDMQVSAVFALGRSADLRWLSTVLDEMLSPETEMRIEAARSAGGLGSSDAISNLEELLYDEDLEVRLAAVTALGQIGGTTAQRILEELAEDPEADDLYEAIDEALEEMDWLDGEFGISLFDLDMDDDFPEA
jgi:hypothetical protein